MTIEEEIAALRSAMATGALKIEYRAGDTMRSLTYRSFSDMERALADLLARASAVAPVTRTVGVVRG